MTPAGRAKVTEREAVGDGPLRRVERQRPKVLTVPQMREVIQLYDDDSAVSKKTHRELALMFQVCIRPSSLYNTVDDNT